MPVSRTHTRSKFGGSLSMRLMRDGINELQVKVNELWFGGDLAPAFRIAAPRTAQRTAFQETSRPRTRPVMRGKFPDVKHNAGEHLK